MHNANKLKRLNIMKNIVKVVVIIAIGLLIGSTFTSCEKEIIEPEVITVIDTVVVDNYITIHDLDTLTLTNSILRVDTIYITETETILDTVYITNTEYLTMLEKFELYMESTFGTVNSEDCMYSSYDEYDICYQNVANGLVIWKNHYIYDVKTDAFIVKRNDYHEQSYPFGITSTTYYN